MKTAEELFKTYGEAQKYCKENNFEVHGSTNPWILADKILKIRKDQDKITRHACAEIVSESRDVGNGTGMYEVIEKNLVYQAIIDTKAI